MKDKLIGQIVNHANKYGQGKIVDYSNHKIKVEFSDGAHSFLYPSAFNKHLTFDNAAMQEEAQKDLELEERAEQEKKEKEKKDREQKASLEKYVSKPKKKTLPAKKKYSGLKYKDWETMYPGYVIIQKEGFMYQAHNESAEKLADILDYELMTDIAGRVTTGGPDAAKIGFALEYAKCNYIIIEDEQIVDQFPQAEV